MKEKKENVVKKVLKEGQANTQPKVGQEVFVHYEGRLVSGQVFDRSRERNEPFSFRVGAGEVIPGWDEGVRKMNKGEQAELVILSSAAYGARGNAKIPPDSPLSYKLGMLEARSAEIRRTPTSYL